MLFGVYLLIRKRAYLRYIFRLLAAFVSLLANIVGILTSYLTQINKKMVLLGKISIFRTVPVYYRWL